MKKVLIVLLGITLACYCFFSREDRSVYRSPTEWVEPVCGLVSVMTVCDMIGVEFEPSESSLSKTDETGGVSMAECMAELQRVGVECTTVPIKSEKDLQAGHPALCAVQTSAGHHAIVVIKNQDNDILIYDGPHSRSVDFAFLDQVLVGPAIVCDLPTTRLFKI